MAPPVGAGLAAGALVYYFGDRLLRRGGPAAAATGPRRTRRALVLGALLDGIPESAAIGLTLISGGERQRLVRRRRVHLQPPRVDLRLGRVRVAGSRAEPIVGCLARRSRSPRRSPRGSATCCSRTRPGTAGRVREGVRRRGDPLHAREHDDARRRSEDGGDRVGLVTVLGFALAALLSAAIGALIRGGPASRIGLEFPTRCARCAYSTRCRRAVAGEYRRPAGGSRACAWSARSL